jgi:hypothetical protein
MSTLSKTPSMSDVQPLFVHIKYCATGPVVTVALDKVLNVLRINPKNISRKLVKRHLDTLVTTVHVSEYGGTGAPREFWKKWNKLIDLLYRRLVAAADASTDPDDRMLLPEVPRDAVCATRSALWTCSVLRMAATANATTS